jgi:hypothetical protein
MKTLTEGERLKENELARLRELRAEYLAEARKVARKLGTNGKYITVDDVREACPVPEGVNPTCLGALFSLDGEWMHTGYAVSERKEAHGRRIGLYMLID